MTTKNGTGKEEFYTLENGTTILLKTVPAFLIQKVQAKIKMPEPPVFIEEETGREIVNTTDPDYIRDVQAAEGQQIAVSMLAAVLFGTQLVDEEGNPIDAPSAEEDDWEAKLAYIGIDWRESLFEEIPLPPNTDLRFARNACYLLYYQMSNNDIAYVAGKALGGEAYTEAVNSFPSGETRNTNRQVRTKRRK